METIKIFGTYDFPTDSNSVVSYNAFPHLSQEMMKNITFEDNQIKINKEIDTVPDVTHESFFGENIKRVINTLK